MEWIHHALDWFSLSHVHHWIQVGGYFVVFSLLFACGLGLPLPEDIPLLISGFLVAQPLNTPGCMHLMPAAVVCWCGIIGGDCVLYSLGRRYGLQITKVRFIGKHLNHKRILWAEAQFEKWGILVVAVGRMFAGVRGVMVVAAGATRFNFVKFVVADGIAAIFSGGLFMYLGFWAGRHGTLEQIRERIQHNEHTAGAILLGLLALFGGWIWWKRTHPDRVEDEVDLDAASAPDANVPSSSVDGADRPA